MGVLLFWRWSVSTLVATDSAAAPSVALCGLSLCSGLGQRAQPAARRRAIRRYQEIIWFSSAYLTPLFDSAGIWGWGWLFWRGYGAKGLLLLAIVFTLSALFFMNYTSAPDYPVSLRLLDADVVLLAYAIGGDCLVRRAGVTDRATIAPACDPVDGGFGGAGVDGLA